MKAITRTLVLFSGLFLAGRAMVCEAADSKPAMPNHNMQHMMHSANDSRISLGLSPQRKQHQLANMRSHVKAVQTIVGLMAQDKFDEASQVAHSELGLTEEMRKMCSNFNNAEFTKIGLAFHQSADELGEVLKTKDTKKSLEALHTTMNFCVQCHATFRQ